MAGTMRSVHLKWVPVLWTLLAFVHRAHSSVKLECQNEYICKTEGGFTCAFHMESVCFRHFVSECELKATICETIDEYILYDKKYCNLEGFMCQKEYAENGQQYIENENLDKIIYSIYKRNIPKKSLTWLI